jgi:alpha-amylase
MTDLLAVGFSGFRIDAAKHISPDNLAAILAKFK